MKKIVRKEKKSKKPLTLHKHYLVDIRRFKLDLKLDTNSFGKDLETLVITRNKKRYLALRVVD